VKNEYDNRLAKIYNDLNAGDKYQKEIEYLNNFIGQKSRILDVGCGTGMHNYLFASLGHDCVGIDISADMVEVATRNNKTTAKFENVSIENFISDEKFDLCISMFNVVNHVLEIENLKKFFESIVLNLKIDGVLVFDCFNSVAVIKDRPRTKKTKGLVMNPTYNPQTGILKMNYSGDNEFSLTHRIWDISVLVEVLNQVGFEVKLYKRNTFLKLSEDDYKITFACRRIK
jgi:2-polyprenyl-3-methyl-5-hydroxy-6-metoxy-1,4-benzoquinol methylase